MDKTLQEIQEAFEEYKSDPTKTFLKNESDESIFVFQDWIKETDNEVKVKTTRFSFYEDSAHMYSHVTKRQKFVCVGGPLHGQKVTSDNDTDYELYNCSSRHSDAPKCVLVFKPDIIK